MKLFIIFINLLYFSFSKQNIECDSPLLIGETSKTLSECSDYEVEENKKCCVGVISIMGKNQYFCQSFNDSATEQDISEEMDKKVKDYEDKYLGAVVKAKASCREDITPFLGTNCNIEDSQNSIEFNNCSNFKKEKDDDFCCLFSGNVLFNNDKNDVQFCYEVNKKETENMDDVAKDIDSRNRMINIKYLNCSPEIPAKKESSFIININYILILTSIILLG